MKKYSYLFLLFFLILNFTGCEKKSGGIAKMHWDRDMCERCKMAISERKFACEAIDTKRNKVYKFDEIGCGVLWLKEQNISLDDVKLYVIDIKSGKWIDAKKAKYVDDMITPMAYGFGAYSKENAPKDKKLHNFDYVKKMIFVIEKKNTQKVNNL